MRPRIAVVGATGAVGREFLRILERGDLDVEEVRLLASPRSAGLRVPLGGRELEVEATSVEALAGADLVFISAGGDVSRELARGVVGQGGVVVDDSAAFRLDPEVPLVVPEINAEDLEGHGGITAIPNCSTTQLVMALYPLHRVNPVRRVVVDTYQSVSGAGGMALRELDDQREAMRDGRQPEVAAFPHRIAANALPEIGGFLENGYSKEEWKMVEETRKILHAPDMAISATCVRVPVAVGHSEAVHVELARPMDPAEARELLSGSPGVMVVDDPAEHSYPMPAMAEGRDEVLVGRVRRDASHPNGLAFWVVSDNLRKGAALNALQIAREIVKRDLLLGERVR